MCATARSLRHGLSSGDVVNRPTCAVDAAARPGSPCRTCAQCVPSAESYAVIIVAPDPGQPPASRGFACPTVPARPAVSARVSSTACARRGRQGDHDRCPAYAEPCGEVLLMIEARPWPTPRRRGRLSDCPPLLADGEGRSARSPRTVMLPSPRALAERSRKLSDYRLAAWAEGERVTNAVCRCSCSPATWSWRRLTGRCSGRRPRRAARRRHREDADERADMIQPRTVRNLVSSARKRPARSLLAWHGRVSGRERSRHEGAPARRASWPALWNSTASLVSSM